MDQSNDTLEMDKIRIIILDFLNSKREESGLEKLNLDTILSSVAQETLEDGSNANPLKYSIAGSNACVIEKTYQFDIEGNPSSDAVIEALSKVLYTESDHAQHLKLASIVGFGARSAGDSKFEVKCAYGTQLVKLENCNDISVDKVNKLSGTVIHPDKYKPAGCIVQRVNISNYSLPYNSTEEPISLGVIHAKDIEYDKTSGACHFNVNVGAMLQSQGIYEVPVDTYHISMFLHPTDSSEAEAQETLGIVVNQLLPGASACIDYSMDDYEVTQTNKTKNKLSNVIEQLYVLKPRELVPAEFDVEGSTEESSAPHFCVKKCRFDEDGSEGLVELRVVQDIDSVPEHFKLITFLGETEPANVKLLIDDNDSTPLFLAGRFSSDNDEVATRGITELLVTEKRYDSSDHLPIEGSDYVVAYRARSLAVSEKVNNPEVGDDDEDDDVVVDNNEFEYTETDVDVGLDECVLPTTERKQIEMDERKQQDRLREVTDMIEKAKLERERLENENISFQKKLIPLVIMKKMVAEQNIDADFSRMGGDIEDPATIRENEEMYKTALDTCDGALQTLKRTKAAYDETASALQAKFNEKELRAKEIRDSFAHFKTEIAKAAINSRTGKSIPLNIVSQFDDAERLKEEQTEKLRLKNISLTSQLAKLEAELQSKEQLAEGLHLIDFEQLKIENLTLNEKIEARTEDIHKFRKKSTNAIQILTHIKEKHQFVQRIIEELHAELATLDQEVTASRDQLSKTKISRDSIRTANDKKKQEAALLKSSLLSDDYQSIKADIANLNRKIRELKQKHANLCDN